MRSAVAHDLPIKGLRLSFASGLAVAIAIFAAVALSLLAIGRRDYPALHTILDTGMALLSGVLALLLWDAGRRIGRAFPIHLAIGFAATSLLELVHVFVTVEWTGMLAPIAQSAGLLRPITWPPAAHVLPIAAIAALWLLKRQRSSLIRFALATMVVAVALFAIFRWFAPYSPPTLLGITRPTLILPPILWLAIAVLCWRRQAADRIFLPLALMSLALFFGHVAMLYSQAPHDTQAMVAHLGKVAGYLILLLSLMQMATSDTLDRIRAERLLVRLNDELELRVRERTTELESANQTLGTEISVRRQAETRVQAQLARLNLLQQITRAIGERQDLGSIFQVVVRTLEDQLPVEFCCMCLYDRADDTLTVSKVGVKSAHLAIELAMLERARIPIDENGLSRCVRGHLVYESDLERVDFPFPQRLLRGGLHSFVIAPLQIESQIFGILLVARAQVQGFSSGECEFVRQLSEHVALASHQAQLYSALQQAYDDLRQTQQAVMQQERLRALGQMASGIAHDINNALSPATLYTETLLESQSDLSPRARDYLTIVQRAVDDVAHTVSRMKEFYRLREGEVMLSPLRLNDLVQQVIDLTRARWSDMALQRGIVISIHTELAMDPPPILGVESEIREALVNLVFNAVDAMPTGGALTLRTKVESRPGGIGNVQAEVIDTGTGMDEDTRRRCLEPFFTTKGERGTGLGLAMVYGVAQRHGAEIEIQSAKGKGTSVCLSFPMPAPIAPSVTSTAAARATPSRLRLLVVDDDPLLLKALRDILEADGHAVSEANGGQAGIDAFRQAIQREETFSAVITDLGMPYVDGRRVASAIKEAVPAMPVILLTGWGQRLISDDDIPPHVDRVLSKPPKPRELRQMLADLCRPDSGQQEI
jgi:signal transduction histidine kinase/ActR/RegA family two-component response regulator